MTVIPNKYSFCQHLQLTPFSHQNEPPRESIFCGKVGTWWVKMALTMLKFLLKRRQIVISSLLYVDNSFSSFVS